MSLILRLLGENFISRGLGGRAETPTGDPQAEEMTVSISSVVNYEKANYPLTGTFANVEGWKWNKTLPQSKLNKSQRIESKLGGHLYNLEEGSVASDWFGGVLHGIKVNEIWETQKNTKRKHWIPKVNTGVYSIYHFSKKLYSNYSSSKILNSLSEEVIDSVQYKTFTLPEEAIQGSVNIYLFKRDTNFNNIPYVTYKYSANPVDAYTYNMESNKLLFLNEYKKKIGTDSIQVEDVQWFDELLGIGNSKRRVFYTEYFPAINPMLKVVTLDEVTIWTKVDSFDNTGEEDTHYIFDSETGKVILSNYDKRSFAMKSYDSDKKFLETFYPLENVRRKGKLRIGGEEVVYNEIGKYGFYLDQNFESFEEGKKIEVVSIGKKLNTADQVFICYEHVPRVDFEVIEGEFWNNNINLKPYTKIESNGILEIGVDEKHLSKIELSCDKEEITENVFQTLYVQQDSTILKATALNGEDKPLEEQDIVFHSEEGAFEGDALKEILEVTNSNGEAHTTFSYPYKDNSLSSVSKSYFTNGSSYLKVDSIPVGAQVDDISVFQILKTDSYFGSSGLKLKALSIQDYYLNNYKYKRIEIEGDVEDKADYQSNQLYLSSPDADRIVRENLLTDGNSSKDAYNFAVCLVEFDNGTKSHKAAIKQIVGESVVIFENQSIEREIAEGSIISGVRLFKKDEMIFEEQSLSKDMRGVNRILYSYSIDNERYERLKPSRIQGNKIWFDNIHLPESDLHDFTNIVAGYKIIMPRMVKVYATGIDPATGLEIRSNRISIKVDFPSYLKTDLGFKFKEEGNEISSGLGGTNFISINPDFANNQINFFVEN